MSANFASQKLVDLPVAGRYRSIVARAARDNGKGVMNYQKQLERELWRSNLDCIETTRNALYAREQRWQRRLDKFDMWVLRIVVAVLVVKAILWVAKW